MKYRMPPPNKRVERPVVPQKKVNLYEQTVEDLNEIAELLYKTRGMVGFTRPDGSVAHNQLIQFIVEEYRRYAEQIAKTGR